MRVLQLSDPHLLADPAGLCRGRPAFSCLRHGLGMALQHGPIDLLLISGDLCQDESWGGYGLLRELLAQEVVPRGVSIALLPGNHDDPFRLQAALGHLGTVAPGVVAPGVVAFDTQQPNRWRVVLLSTHRRGSDAGWLDAGQMAWLKRELPGEGGPILLAMHHPPVAIGHAGLDAIALQQPEALLGLLAYAPQVRGVVFGHIHQHWQSELGRRGTAEALPLWGCPSTLASFEAVQNCPLGQPDWPGGRLLELQPDAQIKARLLRWPPFPG